MSLNNRTRFAIYHRASACALSDHLLMRHVLRTALAAGSGEVEVGNFFSMPFMNKSHDFLVVPRERLQILCELATFCDMYSI